MHRSRHNTLHGSVAALLLAAGWATSPAQAATAVSLTASGYADESGGNSLDLDLALRVGNGWSLWAGGGRSTAESPGTEFAGTAWRIGGGWQGERVGFDLSARDWNDAEQFGSRTLGADFTVQLPAGFSVTALARQRDLDVRYTVTTVLGRTASASNAFDGSGFGAEVSWVNERWAMFARAVSYDYDDSLDAVRAAIASPATRLFPRLQALTDSMLTRATGTTDREYGFTVDRSFARSGLRLDLAESRDALTGESVTGASLSLRYTISPRAEIEATAGQSAADLSGSSAFGGLALTLRL
jgi:hypothetical protein